MPYSHLLVAVAPTPESRVLIQKAVSIARPVNAKVSLITLATDPELYNQFAAPMMENLREVMQEETRGFLAELARHADYPIEVTTTRVCFLAPPVRQKILLAVAASMCCWFVWKKASAGEALTVLASGEFRESGDLAL